MQTNLRRWLNNIPLSDPVERRQAGLLQAMLLAIIGACLIGLLISLLRANPNNFPILGLSIYAMLIAFTGSALALLRRGRFTLAVYLATLGMLLGIGTGLVLGDGLRDAGGALLALTVPITFAGLLLGRRGVLLASGLSEALVIATGLLEIFGPSQAGLTPNAEREITSTIIIFTLIIGVLSLFLDRFGSSLREALTTALAREQELERLRASLETTVAERTASLRQALQDVEQREAQLTRTLADLGASQEAVRELSAPVLPVLPGVIVAPLIGAIDSARAAVLAENVLGMVQRLRVRHVIFDITGVPVVDTHVARVLLETATAVRLLGAQVLLVGIRPEVAQTIVTLGIDLGTIAAYPRLQEAVVALMDLRNGQGTGSAGRIADAS